MKVTFKMKFERSTKGTHFYVSSDPKAVTKSMYVKKDQMPTAADTITVTVETEDE